MHPTTPTVSPTAPAASNTRRTAAGVKADRRSPEGPGLDTGEDRRTPPKAGTTPTDTDHRHNAELRVSLPMTRASVGRRSGEVAAASFRPERCGINRHSVRSTAWLKFSSEPSPA